MTAYFLLNWIDDVSEARPAWYVMRIAPQGGGVVRESCVGKFDRWRAQPGVEVVTTGRGGELRVNALYVVFDTAQPGLVEFRNETRTVIPFEYAEAA